MSNNNISKQENTIFNELQSLINIKEDRKKVIKKYNELSRELKIQILSITTNNGDNLLLLACKNRLVDLVNKIINDCLTFGIENVENAENILDKANYDGITPFIVSIQEHLYEIALKLLNSKYIVINRKTSTGLLAVDVLVMNILENHEMFIESKSGNELFSLLINNYFDDDNEKYEFPQEYKMRIDGIKSIIQYYELNHYLNKDTKTKLKIDNDYIDTGRYSQRVNRNLLTNYYNYNGNNYYLPETEGIIRINNDLPPLAHAEVLNGDPYPYHMMHDDDTSFLITNNRDNNPSNQRANSNIMNSTMSQQLSNTINRNNNNLTNIPETRTYLAKLQANAAEQRILLAKQNEPPAKPPKNVTYKIQPPPKPPKNVTLKLPPPKPPKPTRIGGKTRKIKRCSTKSKSKNNCRNKNKIKK